MIGYLQWLEFIKWLKETDVNFVRKLDAQMMEINHLWSSTEIGFNHSDHTTNRFNCTPPIFGFNMFDDLHLAVLVGGVTFFRLKVW